MKTTQFKQKSKVGVAGSFFNQMMGNNSSMPIVGKGATEMHYSDRSCYEVIEVSADNKTVKLEVLTAKHDSSKGKAQMGHQDWILEPTGRFITIVWRNNAWRRIKKEVVWDKDFYDQNIDGVHYNDPKRKAIYKECFNDETASLNVIAGKTKVTTKYNKINILFGRKDYYYDWTL